MPTQKERRAPNSTGRIPQPQDRQGGQPGKKSGSAGGSGAQSGATGHRGKNSPK